MSEKIKIYTAGKMKGLTFYEQLKWRIELSHAIKNKTDKNISFIHPPLFYNYEQNDYQSEREVKEWEMNQIKNSDIIIVNLDEINDSIGTHFELSFAEAMNSLGHKHIYIIGVGGKDEEIHPWIELSLFRKENNFEDVAEYVVNYLLV